MQKENSVANSVRQIKIRCGKIQICGTESWLLNAITYAADLLGPLRPRQASDLCGRKIPFGILFRVKRHQKTCKKLQRRQKSTPQKWFDQAAFWRVYVYLISSTSMQKENSVANSVRQIKIRCAKYKFAERSHNFLMQLFMQLMVGQFWDLDKLQTCVKGKSISEFRSVSMDIRKIHKIATEQKSTQKRFDWAALWRVYVYLISSTSMQKENPVANSVRQIKIRCAI